MWLCCCVGGERAGIDRRDVSDRWLDGSKNTDFPWEYTCFGRNLKCHLNFSSSACSRWEPRTLVDANARILYTGYI